jgi:hypothetical protein
MIIFVVFYSLGIGNLAWVSSEFFPIEIRALGTMMVYTLYQVLPNILMLTHFVDDLHLLGY